MKKWALALLVALSLPAFASASYGAAGKRIQVTGEIIDTWCYLTEIMGSSDSVTGSAHHQCAVWCAAGGIPVGLLAEDGTVYLVMSLEGDTTNNANPTVLDIQSDQIKVDGEFHQRDGVNYLVVEKILENNGLVNLTHEDYGVVPAFGVPEQ